MEANVELVFKYEKWSCLGKNIAQMKLNKTIVQVSKFCFSIISSKKTVSVRVD